MEKIASVLNQGHGVKIELKPTFCPYCHHEQIPNILGAMKPNQSTYEYILFCECTNNDCFIAFNVVYNEHTTKYTEIVQGRKKTHVFKDVISTLSPSFCSIYNEAYAAEQMGLSQITGVGYRKALEFLIKDYLVSITPENEDAIKSKFLNNCIREDIADEKIKQVAARAVWLGNDETHYIRKWEDKDVTHLKKLIDLCLHWIEAEIDTKQLLDDMPAFK